MTNQHNAMTATPSPSTRADEMTKHTPGPWKAIRGGMAEGDDMRCAVTAVRPENEYLLATIENGAPGDFCETEWSNARLIAAAPELLDALKMITAVLIAGGYDTESKGIVQCRAALAKATGAP